MSEEAEPDEAAPSVRRRIGGLELPRMQPASRWLTAPRCCGVACGVGTDKKVRVWNTASECNTLSRFLETRNQRPLGWAITVRERGGRMGRLEGEEHLAVLVMVG